MILREYCVPIGVVARLLKIFSQFIAIVPWKYTKKYELTLVPSPPNRAACGSLFQQHNCRRRNSPASCQALICINHPNYP